MSVRGSWILLLFAAITACEQDGLIAPSAATTPSSATSEEERVAYELSTQHVDFGDVIAGRAVTESVTISNTGDAPLVLEGVSTSCACTTVHAAWKNIAPGGSGDVEFTYEAPVRTGPTPQRQGSIRLSDVKDSIEIQLTANVVNAWGVEPSTLDFGDDGVAHIELWSREGRAFTVYGVEPGDIAAVSPASTSARHAIRISRTDWLAAGEPGVVHMSTDLPRGARISVPVEKRVDREAATSRLSVTPRRVRLGHMSAGDTRELALTVHGVERDHQRFQVFTHSDALSVELHDAVWSDGAVVLQVRLAAEASGVVHVKQKLIVQCGEAQGSVELRGRVTELIRDASETSH